MAGSLILGYDEEYGGPLSVSVKGLSALSSALTKIEEGLPGMAGNALRAEAEIEMTEAKKRTPVKHGPLRASGHVIGPEQRGDEAVVVMGFGGPAGSGNHGGETNDKDVGYAVYVHENMEALHPIGQSKFLESTMLESIPHLADRVAARIARTLGGP